MGKALVAFISKYVTLTSDEIKIIEDIPYIKSLKKGTVLLREGQLAKNCYFILQGCIRRYYIVDGDEKNTEFFFEHQTITPISYAKKIPSDYFLECLEDSIITISTGSDNQKLLTQIPKLNQLIAKMNEEIIIEKQIMFDDFKNLSPEKRYIKLLETRPDLINRIPQYHLATYLGITPVSLSRLRKRLLSK